MEEQRKKQSDKSTSSKRIRTQLRGPSNSQTQNVLSPVRVSPGLQPLSLTGLSATSFARLSANPQLFRHFSATPGGQHNETKSQEIHIQLEQEGVEKEDPSRSNKEPRLMDVKSQVTSQLRRKEAEDAESLCDIKKVIMGRKT